MKTAFAFLLSVLGGAASAQTQRANTIIVSLPDSGVVAWKRTAQALTANGYGIKASDKELLTLSTDAKAVKRAGDVTLNASVQGRQVLLFGTFSGIGTSGTRIAFRGMSGSPFRAAWDEMQRVAALIAPGAKLTYQ